MSCGPYALGRHRAGTWQAGPGALSPAIRRGSVMLVKLVVRRDVDDRARAQLADVVEVAVPVGGHADGGQARSVSDESEGALASRAACGARQGQAAPQRQGTPRNRPSAVRAFKLTLVGRVDEG